MSAAGLYFGLGLMLVGIALFAIGRRNVHKVTASNGSVAVGGSNSGSITNINRAIEPKHHSGAHGLTIAAIIIEVIGISVTIWHAYHMAAQ